MTRPPTCEAALEPLPDGRRPAARDRAEGRGRRAPRSTSRAWARSRCPGRSSRWARRELPDEKVDRSPAQASEIFSRGDVIYTVGNSAENAAVRAGAGGAERPGGDRPARTARSSRWWAASISSRASTIASPRRAGSPGPASSPSSTAAAFDKGYTPASVVLDAPIVIDDPGMTRAWRPKEDTDNVLRPGAAARGDGEIMQSGLGAPDARHRPRLHLELRAALRLRQIAAAQESHAGARHGRTEPAASGHRLRDLRQRRLQASRPTSSIASRTPTARSC